MTLRTRSCGDQRIYHWPYTNPREGADFTVSTCQRGTFLPSSGYSNCFLRRVDPPRLRRNASACHQTGRHRVLTRNPNPRPHDTAAFGTRNSSTEGQREAKNARFGNRQNRLYGGPSEAGGFGRSAAGDDNTQNLTSPSTHENIEQAAAATKLQSRWRGKRARDDVKEVKQFQNAARIGDCNANGKNTRKTPSRVSSRRKVDGGVHGGSLNVVIRHVHFLRGVYLHVRVVSATDLLSMDSNGTYCISQIPTLFTAPA